MVTLLSLPNEVLVEIFIASPSTRTLLHLSRVNRRMRSIWLEHSHHIIPSTYNSKFPHIEQAIRLTLTEIQCGETSLKSDAARDTPEEPLLRLSLRQLLRNAGLASSVCDAAYRDNKLQKIEWETHDPLPEMLRVYYLIRHTLLAYDHPELRPTLCPIFKGMSEEACAANNWVCFFMLSVAPAKLRDAHKVYERNADAWDGTKRDADQDPLRLSDAWRAVNTVFTDARWGICVGPESFDISGWDDEE